MVAFWGSGGDQVRYSNYLFIHKIFGKNSNQVKKCSWKNSDDLIIFHPHVQPAKLHGSHSCPVCLWGVAFVTVLPSMQNLKSVLISQSCLNFLAVFSATHFFFFGRRTFFSSYRLWMSWPWRYAPLCVWSKPHQWLTRAPIENRLRSAGWVKWNFEDLVRCSGFVERKEDDGILELLRPETNKWLFLLLFFFAESLTYRLQPPTWALTVVQVGNING